MYFAIRNYLPFEKGVALNLNKFGSTLPKDALFQVWLKLVQWFLRRRFLNLVNVYLDFGNYIALENRMPIHLNKPESPSPKDALC